MWGFKKLREEDAEDVMSVTAASGVCGPALVAAADKGSSHPWLSGRAPVLQPNCPRAPALGCAWLHIPALRYPLEPPRRSQAKPRILVGV